MKQGKMWSRVTRAAVLLLFAVLVMSLAGVGNAINAEELKKFNVMLVIDGSGSLVSSSSGTDKNGLRYDAIDLFLALLTNTGNQVGAIVFDDDSQSYLLDTGLLAVSGKEDKLAISTQIRQAGTRKDTDIGSALLSAVEILTGSSANEDNKNVIVLFSDGRTDLGSDQEAYAQSLQNKDTAITMAQGAGIPIYSICLNASPVADPEELQEISDRTGGGFVSVSTPEDLALAFETFYSLIFSTAGNERVDSQFPDSGELSFDISVPSYGAEEVNIILDTSMMTSLELYSPEGQMDVNQVNEATMRSGDYDVIKLADPVPGMWRLDLCGVPENKVTINVIYNVDSSAVLTTTDGGSDYPTGGTVGLQLELCQNGSSVGDTSVTEEYAATLELTNLADGSQHTVEMLPGDNGAFVYEFICDDYTSYEARATLSCDSLVLETNTVKLNFGNTAPTLRDGADVIEERVIVTPITGRERTFRLDDLFSDEQDGTLTYSVVSSQLVSGTAKLEDGVVTVNTAESRSGDLVVRAADSQGAYTDLTIRFKVTNLTLVIFLLIAGGILAAALIVGFLVWNARPRFRGTLTVVNINPSMGGLNRSHATFRGKVKLRYFMVGTCGMDGDKSCFVARPGGRLEFRAAKPFYINGEPKTKVDLFAGNNVIYADAGRTMGIRVSVRPK